MLRWFDGFDYYATADLTSNYNIVGVSMQIVAAIGRFGSGALRNVAAGGSEVLSKFFGAQGKWIVGFALKFTVGGHDTVVASVQSDTTNVCDVRLTASNIFRITKNGTQIAIGSNPLLTSTFYYIEVKFDLAGGACEVKVNGISEVSVTGQTFAASSATRVNIHYDFFSHVNTFDDYYICDGTGSANNDFLGDMRVETSLVDSAGTYSEWTVTGGGGSHVTSVSETTPDGDTSYVASSTLNQRETWGFANLASTPSFISGIKMTAIARKDDAGLRAITPLIRVAGTDYLGTAIGVGDSYSYLVSIFETNPGTTVPWTGSDVNALDAGWKLTT